MRILHFVQPRRCAQPEWPCLDQRSDAPLAAIARLCSRPNRLRDTTVVFGGSQALRDARAFGLNPVAHAPICGHSALGLGRLRQLGASLLSDDVLVGWGIQFVRVFDRLAPRSNAIVIDLATGRPHVRSLMQSAWHKLSPLPARLGGNAPVQRPRIDLHSRNNPVAFGLCRDGPSIEPVASFIFALGGVSVSGFEVDAVVRDDVRELCRLRRHIREGGRLHAVKTLNRPLPLAGEEADFWILALTSKSGVMTSSDFIDWASMLTADSLSDAGYPVAAALPRHIEIAPSIAPRTMRAKTQALSDVAGALRNWLTGSDIDTFDFEPTDVCGELSRIASRISAGEPIADARQGGG